MYLYIKSSKGTVSYDTVFKELNAQLSNNNIELTIICSGGYALSCYGIRKTIDVDAFFNSSKQIDAIIRNVGDMFGINNDTELWLNNSISNMNATPDLQYCTLQHEFSN